MIELQMRLRELCESLGRILCDDNGYDNFQWQFTPERYGKVKTVTFESYFFRLSIISEYIGEYNLVIESLHRESRRLRLLFESLEIIKMISDTMNLMQELAIQTETENPNDTTNKD